MTQYSSQNCISSPSIAERTQQVAEPSRLQETDIEQFHVSSTANVPSKGAPGNNSSKVFVASFDLSVPTFTLSSDALSVVLSSLASASASFADTSRAFFFRETKTDTSVIKLKTSERIQSIDLFEDLERLSLRHDPQAVIYAITNMFGTISVSGIKRGREGEEDETTDYKSKMSERRIARARDNSASYNITANNISKNSLNSTSFFVPVSDSPPRARSNALSVPQKNNLTPYPSDTEEVHHNGSGFAKILSLSLRSRTSGHTQNPFSAAQSPAGSFDSVQHMGDSQDTSMATEDSQNDFVMDLDMDDAPVNSPGASFSQPTNFGSLHIQADNYWQASIRLPSPAESESDRAQRCSSLDVDNFGQMGMQLHGARQDAKGQWNSRANSFGGSQNLGHVATGMAPASQNKKKGGRLVMGYRADCKKCRDKVPGHYNHFL